MAGVRAEREGLRARLDSVPASPGVYLFKDRRGKVLYVGKARRLKSRVRSYFQRSRPAHPKLDALLRKVDDLDVIVTTNEVEALILEMTLIKEHRPRYNISLKDDKRYPYLKVTMAERFPKVVVTRRVIEDGARYFGPFTDAGSLRSLLHRIRAAFPLRSCRGERPGRGPQMKECLDYYIHRCNAPCIDLVGEADYRALAERFCLFFTGKGEDVVLDLKREMDAAGESLDFEHAARLRDQIEEIQALFRRQGVTDLSRRDTDAVGLHRLGNEAHGVVLKVRAGKVLAKESFTLRGVEARTEASVYRALLAQVYAREPVLPATVLVPVRPDDADTLEEWLSSRRGAPVELREGKRGNGRRLVEMACANARADLEESLRSKGLAREAPDAAVYDLQRVLALDTPPLRIEGYDISNFQGAAPVASLVVFENGRPHRSDYRRFRIRKVEGPDDFRSMAEVVGRRAVRVREGEFPRADLLLIDGGKGQVAAATKALRDAGLGDLRVAGLAKREEEIFPAGARDPIRLPRTSAALRLLMRVRDEAHRFAVTYHRNRRGRETFVSELDAIPGVGPERRLRLLRAFGSVEAVRAADAAAIAGVDGIGPRLAGTIHDALAAGTPVPERSERG